YARNCSGTDEEFLILSPWPPLDLGAVGSLWS
ncbi:unnamed protein product, partial [Rotaria socialis]